MKTTSNRLISRPTSFIAYSRLLLLVVALLLLPATTSWAQRGTGGISGVVTDVSGAVVPGVTVEARSAALIEGVRSVTTEGNGQYRIVDLRPGVYSVTFTLAGFRTVRREGLELSSGVVALLNAQLVVGDREETITVIAAGTTTDVSTTTQQKVLTRQFLDATPSGKLYTNLGALIPGVVTSGGVSSQDVGGSIGMNLVSLATHGGRTSDMQVQIDGMGVGTLTQGSNFTYIVPQDGAIQEYAIETAAQSAESETGGIRINIIPKEGGNVFRGLLAGNYTGTRLQSSNFSEDLRARNLRAPNRVKRMWDVNPSAGGPILRDRLWYYSSYRSTQREIYIGGLFYNRTPESVFYTPDVSRQAFDDQPTWGASGRVTWRASDQHKFNFYYEHNFVRSGHNFISPTRAPEAAWKTDFDNRAPQAVWTATLSQRLLMEAGASAYFVNQPRRPSEGFFGPPVVEGSNGLNYRAPLVRADSSYGDGRHNTYSYRAAMTFFSGAHTFKAGLSAKVARFEEDLYGIGDTSYRFLNQSPSQVTYYATPFSVYTRINPNLGLFVQEQWTRGPLTLTGGLRFDYLHTAYDDQRLPAGTYVPSRTFEGGDLLAWRDLSPRVGAAYNLSGNGATVLRVTLNRFVNQEALEITRAAHPVSASLNTATRSWSDTNGNFVPEEDELGPLSNSNFGRSVPTLRFDSDWAEGFGTRPFNWETTIGLERQVVPALAVSGAFIRRWYGNFRVTDNLLVDAADFDPYCITSPVDSRLPRGGGQRICGFFDVKQEKFGLVDNLASTSSNYGEQREHWNGVDLTARVALASIVLQGGLSTGTTMTDNCDVVTKVTGPVGPTGGAAAFNPSQRFCHTETPWLTQVKLVGLYRLPWELSVSSTFQSIPGNPISANYVASNNVIRPELGRNLSTGANGTVTINLIEPGTEYGDRVNQVDLRVSRGGRVGRMRFDAMVDVFNAFNAAPVVTYNTNYGTNGATWLTPQTILSARLVKIGINMSF